MWVEGGRVGCGAFGQAEETWRGGRQATCSTVVENHRGVHGYLS